MKTQITPRKYQLNILKTCIDNDTLIVLPTGLGKTLIAILLAKELLQKYPNKKVLVLAPTRPLVEQHKKSFLKFFDELDIVAISGKIKKEKRAMFYRVKKIIIATPQVIRNDILSRLINPQDYILVVFDEAHRATGNYPYVFIAKYFKSKNENIRFIGLTASPGNTVEKVKEIMKNLFLTTIEIRTDESPDVKPYIKGINIKWVFVKLSEDLKKCINLTKELEKEIIKKLNDLGYDVKVSELSKKYLLELKRVINKDMIKNKNVALKALTYVNQLIILHHILELLNSQGVPQTKEYIQELIKRIQEGKSTRYLRDLLLNEKFRELSTKINELYNKGFIHDKLNILLFILKNKKYKRCIVFSQLRHTAKLITKILNENNIKAQYFAGQKDLKQSEQLALIKAFQRDEYKVLVATSVAEEGLDIPEVDLIIFYEPVPSEIRHIQRKGRTGRSVPGTVYVLVSKGIEEKIYWSLKYKEKKFKELINELSKYKLFESSSVKPLVEFFITTENSDTMDLSKSKIIVDDRETKTPVVEKILEEGVEIEVKRLPIGDYIVGEYLIERKSAQDFINSILDNRLFEQIKALKNYHDKVILILEGDVFSMGFRPEPIMGAIVSIITNFNIPVIFTENPSQTGLFLVTLFKKTKQKTIKQPVIKKMKTIEDIQENILMQFPGIGVSTARKLLKEFGSLKNIFNAPVPELRKVVGDALAKKLKMILENKYSREE